MKPETLALTVFAAVLQHAGATLLVYDGYDYTAGSNLGGTAPSGSTVGLDTSLVYAGTATNNYTVNASSLSFSNLVTTGGSIQFTTGTNALSARLSLGTGTVPYAGADLYAGSSPYVGTLYNSYLVRLTVTPTSSTTVEGRVSASDAASSLRFISAADTRIPLNADGGQQTAVSYDTSDSTSGIITPSGSILATNQTYLVVSKFTSVGSSVAIGAASATQYVLSSAQFDSFINAGGTESYLDSATIGTGSGELTARVTDLNGTSGTFSFANGNAVQYLTISSGGTIDETRYGTTLADVVPIPEPASAWLVLGPGFLCFFRRRR